MSGAIQALDAARGRRKNRGHPDWPTDPVRSHSYDVKDRKASPHRRIGGGTPQEGIAFRTAMKKTIDELELEHARGDQRGHYRMTPHRAMVLKTLIDKVDHKTGQLDPSWQMLATDSGRSRRTVDRALEAGEHQGFISHVRRSVVIEGAEGQRAPQRKQTSSAVYFDCLSRMEPKLYAKFWDHYVKELARFGVWFKQRARRILTTFNSVATPSPREPKTAQLVARARKAAAAAPPAAAPARVPVQGKPGRPANVQAPTPKPAEPRKGYCDDIFARMAAHFGIDPGDILNEGAK